MRGRTTFILEYHFSLPLHLFSAHMHHRLAGGASRGANSVWEMVSLRSKHAHKLPGSEGSPHGLCILPGEDHLPCTCPVDRQASQQGWYPVSVSDDVRDHGMDRATRSRDLHTVHSRKEEHCNRLFELPQPDYSSGVVTSSLSV